MNCFQTAQRQAMNRIFATQFRLVGMILILFFACFFFRQLFYIFQFLLEIRERELKYMNIVHASKSMQVCTSETEKQ